MKKLLSLVMSICLLGGLLAACSTDQTAASAQSTASAASAAAEWTKDTPMKIGFSQNKLSVAFRVAGVEQLKQYVQDEGLNWEIIVTDGNNDAAKQTADIEDLISQGVDAIIMCPVTADTMGTAAKAVMDAGIPLVLVNRKVTNEEYTVAITGSNYMIGQVVADDMAKKLGEKGSVALIEGTLGASDATERTRGFLETIANYPDIEVVAQASGDFVKDKGMAVMEDILIKYPNLDGVFCENDDMAQGAYQAIEAVGRAGEILIYGNDCYRSTLDLIKAGKVEGTTVYPTSVQAAADVLVEIFSNGGVYTGEKEIIQDVPLCTIDNIDDYYDTLALNA
ncbi:MAG: substrate-binding domain-containing protein [Oscillospiraceae bacterium]